MALKVMKRVENKYLVDTNTYTRLINEIEKHTSLDEYNQNQDFYTITNIYYDTDDNHLIRTSLSKPKYKEKLRLRAYGIPTESDNVFLEIKKKYEGVVNKRRVDLPLSDAYEFAETYHIANHKNCQITKEIEYALRLYHPTPKVYIAYDRRAYFGENDLRITFDTNIRTRRYDLRLEYGDYGNPLLENDIWVIETKTNGALPLWLARLFSEYKVYATSFSKYGTEYKQFLTDGGKTKCLNQFSTQGQVLQLMPQLLPLHGKARLSQSV